ncbi:hypothetical protein [Spirulina subsalsa]|uniref:hypothetical protein n=1 Tax=Spirulina subsalsa TaxID=54311 RepID=UPI00037A0987|nr:hypothetical protein [Spirulina subsalsa]
MIEEIIEGFLLLNNDLDWAYLNLLDKLLVDKNHIVLVIVNLPAFTGEMITVRSSKFLTFSISWLVAFTASITGKKNRTNLGLPHRQLIYFHHKHQF